MEREDNLKKNKKLFVYLIAPLPAWPGSFVVQPNVNISTATQLVQLLRHWVLISSHVGHQQEGHLRRAGAEAAQVRGHQIF